MKKGFLYFFAAIILSIPFNSFAQATITSAQTGNWNAATTWVGGVIPTSVDAAVIANGHNVTRTAVGDTCATLTLQPNATVTLANTITAGAMPCASWSCDATSTVVYSGPTTIQTNSPYGNLTYGSANGSPNGDLTVNGNLTITANTVRGISAATGSRTHTILGDVLLTGTSSRISAVNFTGASTSSCVWNVGGSVKLTGANSGCRVIVWESAGEHAGAATFNIGGNLEITGAGSQVQFKSSSGTSDNYSEGIINLKGDLVQNGPIGINSVSAGVSPGLSINFVGTNPQAWSGAIGTFSASSSLTFKINVNINNAAGVTLTDPRGFNTNTVLNLTNGKLTTTAANLLTLSGTATISGGSSSSYIDGSLALTYSAAGSQTFPIGSSAAYRPVTINATTLTGTGTITVSQTDGIPGNTTLPATIDKISTARYWTITPAVGITAITGNVGLTWGSDDGISDLTHVTVVRGTHGGAWDIENNAGGTIGTSTLGTATGNDFISFGDFTFGNLNGGTNALPVELTSFTAKANEGIVELTWVTATEANNSGFDIERRIESAEWQKIGFVKGSGSSTTSKDYSFTDKPKGGMEFQYRLKQIDFDGTFQYSNVVTATVQYASTFMLDQNYPNPFNPSTSISYQLSVFSNVNLKVFDVLGNEIAILVNEVQNPGTYTVHFNANQLSGGIYFYKLTAGKFTDTKKFIFLK